MAKETSYGKKGGTGPTRGLVAATYLIRLNGITYTKRNYFARGTEPPGTMIATGFMHLGRPKFVLWTDKPIWEGDFGRLTATLAIK